MIFVLLSLALILFLLEIFLPGGVIALVGVVLIGIASVYAFIDYGPSVGLSVFVGGLLVSLLFFYLELKVLAGTRFGRSVFTHQQVSTGGTGLGETSQLIGQEGLTLTPMSPGGKVRLGDQVYSAVSIDGYIAKGSTVIVKDADTFSIRVSNR